MSRANLNVSERSDLRSF